MLHGGRLSSLNSMKTIETPRGEHANNCSEMVEANLKRKDNRRGLGRRGLGDYGLLRCLLTDNMTGILAFIPKLC